MREENVVALVGCGVQEENIGPNYRQQFLSFVRSFLGDAGCQKLWKSSFVKLQVESLERELDELIEML